MDPAHSPKTAPMDAKVAATRIPEKIRGRAAGNSTRRKIAHRPASSVRIMRMYSPSTERRPSSPLTTIGKKQIKPTMINLGSNPKPNSTTRMGASTITGIVCEAMSRGYTARRRGPKMCSTTAMPMPAEVARAKPMATSRRVVRVAGAKMVLQSLPSELATSVGTGTRYSGSPARVTMTCQATSEKAKSAAAAP